jgi:uncharacterized protein (TIRG00374 family)
VFFLLRQIELEQLLRVLGQTDPLLIGAAFVAVLGSVVTRTARWQVLFLPERQVPFRPLFETLSISYMASTFLPLRAGEVVRAVFLGQSQAIAVPRIVGTILLEKLFDFLAIGVMLTMLVALVPSLPPEVRVGGASIATVILGGFGFVVALAIWREPTLFVVRLIEQRIPFQLGERLQLVHAARQFAEGTDALRVPRLWIPMLGWTAVTWLCAVVTVWWGAAALNVHPGAPAIVLAVVITSISQAVPSSPGYVGVYHGAVTWALVSFGVNDTTAFAVAVVTHALTYGALVLFGLVALWTGGYSLTDVVTSFRTRAPAADEQRAVPTAEPEVASLAPKR